MLIEALVITSCLSYGTCNEPLTAYYESKPALKRFVQRHEDKAERFLAKNYLIKDGLIIVTPLLALATGGRANIKFHKNFILSFNSEKTTINFVTGF